MKIKKSEQRFINGEVELGDLVQDVVNNFKGIAVQRVFYLHGCTRIGIQPPINKEGKLSDTAWFDEPGVKIIKKGVVKPDQSKISKMGTGGFAQKVTPITNPK